MLEYSLQRSDREISLPSLYNPLEINFQNFSSPQEQQGTQDTNRKSLQALSSPESRISLNPEEKFYCNLLGLDQNEQDQLLELMKNPGDLLDDVPDFSQMEEHDQAKSSPSYLEAIARFLTDIKTNQYTANEKAIQLFRIAMSFYELEAAKNIAIYSTNSPANFPLYSRENFALISPENLDQLYVYMRDDFFKSIIECPYDISPSNEHGFDCSLEQSKKIIEAAIKKIKAFAKILSEDPDEFLVKVFQGGDLETTTSTGYKQEEKLRLSNHFTNLENAPDEMLEFFEESGFGKEYNFLLGES
jgi:hypothetical protein